MAQFATVAAIKGNGTVFAVDAQGNSRALKVGDVLQKGETVRTVGDVQVELLMEDGRLLSVAPAQSVRLDEQVTDSDQRPSAQDSAVAAPAAIDAVIQALERGGDLSQELEAAAAGLGGGAGGAADGGNSFVRLLRITEPLEPLAYNYSFAAPEIEPDIQAVPEETQEPTVTIGITIGAQVGQGEGGPGLISGEIIQGGVSGVGVPEGSDGNAHSVTFLISLNQVATTDVTVTYTIVPGTASHPADYFDGATTGTVTIPAGYTGFFVTENIVGDILVEGDETFTIVLSNPIGATLTNDTATVTIVDDDHAPVAVDDANSLTEDQISVSGNVLPNDSDVDGQTLSVVGPSVTVTNAYGTLVLNSATGGYTFTMNEETQEAAQALDDGESIVMAFPDVYQVSDGANLSNFADITITITGTNDGPVITTDSGNPEGANDLVSESGLAIIGSDAGANSEFASGTFTVSDADGLDDIQNVTINGDTVAISSLVGHSFAGASGTLTVTAYSGGIASYSYELTSTTTDVDGAETDVFTLTTSDGTATSAEATITIEIVDDLPTASPNTNSVDEGATVGGNVLTDGTDDVFGADGATAGGGVVGVKAGSDTSTPAIGGLGGGLAGAYGTLTLNADGSYTYESDPDAVPAEGATDTFVYTIEDGDGDLSTTTLIITLTDSGLAATNDDITVNEAALSTGSSPSSTDETAAGTLVGNVSGGTPGYTYVLVGSGDGSYGTLTLNPDGIYSYTLDTAYDTSPDADDGTNTEDNRDTFTYQATDANGNTVTSTITVDIIDDVPTATNDGLLATVDDNVASFNVGTVAGLLSNDHYGADGAAASDSITIATGSLGGSVTISGGNLLYTSATNVTPGADQTETFTYTIKDADGDTKTATFTVTLTDTKATIGTPVNSSVDEEGLGGGNAGDSYVSGDLTGEAISVTGQALNINFGTDGAGSVTFDGTQAGLAGLSSGGQAVSFALLNGGTTLVGYTGGVAPTDTSAGSVVFYATLSSAGTGSYSFTLVKPLDHATANTEDDKTLTFAFSAADAEGEGSSSSFTVTVDDDAPTTTNDGLLTTVSEKSSGVTIGVLGDLTGDDSYGADGAATTGAITIAAGDKGGTVTIDGSNNLVYTNTTQNVANGDTVTETFTYTIKDADGDTKTATFTVNLTDTGVTIGAAPANLLADEDDIAGAGGNPGGPGDLVTPVLNGTISYTLGQDAIGSVTLSTAGGATGLKTLSGEDVVTTFSNGVLIGYVSGTDPTQVANQVFTITLGTLGATSTSYTMALLKPLLHTTTGTEDDATAFTVNVVVADADGSTANTSFTVVVVDDDTPTLQADNLVIANVQGTYVGDYAFSVGADSQSFADSFDSTALEWTDARAGYTLVFDAGASDADSKVYHATNGSETFFNITVNSDGTYDFELVTPDPVTEDSVDILAGIAGGSNLSSYTIDKALFGGNFDLVLTGYKNGTTPDTLTISSTELGVSDNVMQGNKGDKLRFDVQPVSGSDATVTELTIHVASTGGFKATDSVTTTIRYDDGTEVTSSQVIGADQEVIFTFDTTKTVDYVEVAPASSSVSFKIDGVDLTYSTSVFPDNYELQFQLTGTDADSDAAAAQFSVAVNTTDTDTFVISGTSGNDTYYGTADADVFKWSLSDQGTTEAPAADVIANFNLAPAASGGDALDLKDLLTGEHANAASLDAYLDFSANDSGQTVVSIHADGSSGVTQTITLENVQYTALQTYAGGTSDAAIITKLLTDGNLKTDV